MFCGDARGDLMDTLTFVQLLVVSWRSPSGQRTRPWRRESQSRSNVPSTSLGQTSRGRWTETPGEGDEV